ncbi:MAG: hypothetical protein QOI24_4201 [Acidobacteriota bacterium]|jgi:hypothetical protein|nr:hypothetical protein [Acidobacteriota bacterium]
MSDTITGIDTYLTCTSDLIACFKQNGYSFIGRYYFNLTKTIKEKFTAAEAAAISAAGLSCVAVYENQSNTSPYFTAAKGTTDAQGALAQAQALGQPAGSAIYFAVDCDLTSQEISSGVVPYFQSVNAVIGDAYAIGVYGSGLTCTTLLDGNLATFAWLTCSMGFAGSKSFTRWNIRQSDEQTICGIDVDPDVATEEFGQFQLSS